jgi:hypothetical protein
MSRACSICGGDERCIQGFFGGKPVRPRQRWEHNIKWIFRKLDGGSMDQIDLAEDRDGWRALVNAVINL